MTENLSPQDSVIAPYKPYHQHAYQITATDTTFVRWCPTCGKTWIMMQSGMRGEVTYTWKEIEEIKA